MKTEQEIRQELDWLKSLLFKNDVLETAIPEIKAKITALQWVLGITSDIFND